VTGRSIVVCEASENAVVDVLRLLDGAMLAIDSETVAEAVDREDVLVAVDEDDARLVGAVVLSPHEGDEGAHVEAIAVQRERRNRGIGRRLVDAAADRNERLTADFRRELEPFWHSLGFTVEDRATRRWGQRDTSSR
jgi:ribosomal protein S18 acetylase RimI-like enzyme